ncbi:preprotein translocase subunit SecG [Pseudoroseicyclus sp. CXY001]|uniref:preprotein translocase subunit SecG n=1 Tax=Pseudoroseicyclus sp. CXY001 TaxID=3242492 RepID=UPI0035715CE0
METVVLIIDLLLALSLIGVVLLQRSEGGGLGMGGGGGGVMSGRAAADALGKVTWGLGTAFFVCTLALTIISAENSSGASVIDRIQPVGGGNVSTPDLGTSLLPPSADESGPVVPNAEDTEASVPGAAPSETPAETPEGFTLPQAGEEAPAGDFALPEADAAPEADAPEAAEPEAVEPEVAEPEAESPETVTPEADAPAADDAADDAAPAPAEEASDGAETPPAGGN